MNHFLVHIKNARTILISLWLIASVTLFANNHNNLDRTITREQAGDDLELYFQIIDQQHGNPYQYLSREAFKTLIDETIASLPENITFKSFDLLLTELNTNLRCGHTTVTMDTQMLKEATFAEQYFPYPVQIIEGAIYIDFEKGDIPHASKILSINGIDAETMAPALLELAVTDGFSSTKPLRVIESKFGYYFFLKYGAASTFEVVYETPAQTKENARIDAIAGNKMLANNYYRPVNESHERYNRFTHLDAIDSLQTLVLTLNTFQANPDWFYKRISSRYNGETKEFDFENLVVDLRINEGGDRRLLNILYQFLTGSKLSDPSKTSVRSLDIQMKDHLLAINGHTLSNEVIDKAEGYLAKHFNIAADNGFASELQNWHEEFDTGINWEGKTFEGQIYVLTSGKTFSAAADLARILGQLDNVTLVGEETGGAHVGRAANMLLNYQLPNTAAILQVPVIYEEFVNVSQIKEDGRGTYPDHLVRNTYQDLLAKRDAVFNYTLDLIKSTPLYGSN